MDRRLSLRSERLAQLSVDELGSVAGAAAPPTLNQCPVEVTGQFCVILSIACLTGQYSIDSACTR